jgi:hypothetical protein
METNEECIHDCSDAGEFDGEESDEEWVVPAEAAA